MRLGNQIQHIIKSLFVGIAFLGKEKNLTRGISLLQLLYIGCRETGEVAEERVETKKNNSFVQLGC